MALTSEPQRNHRHHIAHFLQSSPSNAKVFRFQLWSTILHLNYPLEDLRLLLSLSNLQNCPLDSTQTDSFSSSESAIKGVSCAAKSNTGYFPAVRISGLNFDGKGDEPAFVGQVFSMCDRCGTDLMTVSSHFDIPSTESFSTENCIQEGLQNSSRRESFSTW